MTKEQTYDTEIFGLMKQIIEICKREKIAMVASFDLGSVGEDTLLCTTNLLTEDHEPCDRLLQAADLIQHGQPSLLVNVRDAEGKIASSTAFV